MFEPLREDPKLFRQLRVDDELGTIVWPNGADMDPDYCATTRSRLIARTRLQPRSHRLGVTIPEAN
jgi:hypothetical protein